MTELYTISVRTIMYLYIYGYKSTYDCNMQRRNWLWREGCFSMIKVIRHGLTSPVLKGAVKNSAALIAHADRMMWGKIAASVFLSSI